MGRGVMKIIFFLLPFLLLLSGCFVVIRDEDKVRVIGSRKEVALDTLDKIQETELKDKREIRLFRK